MMTCKRLQRRNETMYQNTIMNNNLSLPSKEFEENSFQISKSHDGGILKYLQHNVSIPNSGGLLNVQETHCTASSDLKYVSDIIESDVLLGNGADGQEYNKKFADLVNQNGSDYSRSNKLKKLAIARRVVDEIKKSDAPGRFLSLEEGTGRWYIISDRLAAKEVGKVLGENTCLDISSNESGDASTADEQVGYQELSGINHFSQDDCKDKKRKRDIDCMSDSASNVIKSPRRNENYDNNIGSEASHPILKRISNYLAMNQAKSYASMPNLPPYSLNDINVKADLKSLPGMSKDSKQYASVPPLKAIDVAEILNVPANNTENTLKHVEAMRENFFSALSLNSTLPRSTNNLKALISNDLKIEDEAYKKRESSKESELNFVDEIRPHDILCGRGGMTNNHFGNKRFRKLVDEHRRDYIDASKIKKPDVARLIVKTIRSETPAGRFLKKDAKTGKWYEISNRKAAEKASQALREKLHLRN